MSLFKKILKELLKTQKTKKVTVSRSKISSEAFNELLSIYKKNKVGELDLKSVILEQNPDAKPNQCPYCYEKFDFVASRARKCPKCNNKMVVRQSLFLTEKNVSDIENQVTRFSDKIGAQIMLETVLESAQREKNNNDSASYYKDIATGYAYAARIKNEKSSDGFDYWDISWRYFNQARLETMSNTGTSFSYTSLPEISFEMTRALKSQYGDDKAKQNRILFQLVMSVAEYFKFDNDPWISDEIYEIGQKAIQVGEISDVEQEQIYLKAIENQKLNSTQQLKFRETVDKIKAYVIFR